MAAGRQWLAGITAALALAACSSLIYKPPPPPDPRLRPADYRRQIINLLPTILDDVSAMRDTAITELALTDVDGVSLYTACVRFNPRKSRTEYRGVQERFAIFHGGELAQFVPATAGQCAKAAWQPFPELAKHCVGDHCLKR